MKERKKARGKKEVKEKSKEKEINFYELSSF